ncbi:MAG: hypothetical protein WDN00_15080 [Limisphaerales bacterium]
MSGNYVYVAAAGGFYVVNVANPSTPAVVGSLPQSSLGSGFGRGVCRFQAPTLISPIPVADLLF